MAAFILAAGSSGKGLAMSELRSVNSTLAEPEGKSDIHDANATVDLKNLKQEINASLDRSRQVLINRDGSPESRGSTAQIADEAISACLPALSLEGGWCEDKFEG